MANYLGHEEASAEVGALHAGKEYWAELPTLSHTAQSAMLALTPDRGRTLG